jgi:trehalose 6-phosphate synthase
MTMTSNEVRDKWLGLRDEYFGERPVIIAANRAPVKFEREPNGEFGYSRGAGGLVTALTGLAQYLPATWVACARTPADAEWRQGDISLDGDQNIHIRFLNPESEAYDGYYNVIANPLLWFIQHSMWDLPRLPIINRATWQAWEEGYLAVNRMFAEAIVEQTRHARQRPLVMLQDYHLYLAGRYIRDRMRSKNAPTLLHFVHIPWPGPEYWRILPPTMRQPILDGLCAMDILGFQTMDDRMNFLRTIESYLPRSAVKYKRGRIWYRNHATYVRDFPISIDVRGLRQIAKSEEVAGYRAEIESLLGEKALIARVDRAEPSKNILRGFQAFEELLELYPEHRGHVKFLAYLIPSRLEVTEYQNYMDDLMAAVGRVNARFGDGQWEPIRVQVSENYPRAVAAMQLYDVLLVNSIADGMNLVAKEGPIVNQRDGVLILSERTGARQQLEPGALVIAPCDIYATAEAMHQALSMSKSQRKEQAARLRWIVEREDITAWLFDQLETVRELGL